MKWKTSEKKSSIFSSFGTISEKYSVNSSNKISIEWIKKCEESARLIKCSWKLNQSLITPWNYAKKTLNWVLTGVKISLFFLKALENFLFFSFLQFIGNRWEENLIMLNFIAVGRKSWWTADIFRTFETRTKTKKDASWPNLCFGLSVITNCLIQTEKASFGRKQKEF